MSKDLKQNEAAMLREIQLSLDRDVAGYDAATRSKLNQARQRALAANRNWAQLVFANPRFWGTGITAALAILALSVLNFRAPSLTDGTLAEVTQFSEQELALLDTFDAPGVAVPRETSAFSEAQISLELALPSDEIEIAADLEFYQWLSRATSAPESVSLQEQG